MKKLIDIIKEFNLNQTDKHSGHSYIDHFYQDFFEPYRDKELNILEIGTREGDSVRLWKQAFPKSKIYLHGSQEFHGAGLGDALVGFGSSGQSAQPGGLDVGSVVDARRNVKAF